MKRVTALALLTLTPATLTPAVAQTPKTILVLHEKVTLSSRGYQATEPAGNFGKLSDVTGKNRPDIVSTGGKITVCAARLRVYTR